MTVLWGRKVGVHLLVAAVIGFVCGAAMALVARLGGFGLAQGYFMILLAIAVLGVAAVALERLQPRSGWPVGVLVLSTLLGAGPLGLYYLLPAVVLVTPVALYRALRQRRDDSQLHA